MRNPMLKQPAYRRVTVDRFLGYEHVPDTRPGAFYDMENLSSAKTPQLSVRPKRTEAAPGGIVAMQGGLDLTLLYEDGTLGCGDTAPVQLLDTERVIRTVTGDTNEALVAQPETVLAALPENGVYTFVYDDAHACWRGENEVVLPYAALPYYKAQPEDGAQLLVFIYPELVVKGERQLVRMGSFLICFPDGKYIDLEKLRAGEALVPGEDFGSIAQRNECSEGAVRLVPCGLDGTEIQISCADTAPEEGYWIDPTDPERVLKQYSQSRGQWVETASYVKCFLPGIAEGMQQGDSVRLSCVIRDEVPCIGEITGFFSGAKLLQGVYRDAAHEGEGDYIILPGLLSQAVSFSLDGTLRSYFRLRRELPEMDFVVECGNRLWGCRSSGGVNEIYGSKLGDFRNWNCFSGLSTDSYRASRGSSGVYTGAAVLGGCPLFFRESCVEKLFPAANGAHSIVTTSLEGVEQGSHRSLQLIRDKLYYKSRRGVCCYSGALPVCISEQLGPAQYHNASAGVRGNCYYISMQDETGEGQLFVYDTEQKLWFRESEGSFAETANAEDLLYCRRSDGSVFCIDPAQDSEGVHWFAETGALAPRMQTSRYVSRLQLRYTMEPGAEVRLFARYDGGGWHYKGRLRGGAIPRSTVLPLHPRRCRGLRLRLEGIGGFTLESLSYLTEQGSDET